MAGSMSIFSAMRTHRDQRAGVTLVEIMVVPLIISMLSAISFPAFKIIQQREKERRLRKILEQTRAAISGSKSQQSSRQFVEGFRNYVKKVGTLLINDTSMTDAEKQTAHAFFNRNLTRRGYPPSPDGLITPPASIKIATGAIDFGDPAADYVEVEIEHRFVRNIPPHPFKGWYPNARWEFKPSDNTSITVASEAWVAGGHYGVTDIVSRGAGIGLNGSSTDEW